MLAPREEIWKNFDEGAGAIHLIDARIAEEIWETAKRILGGKLQ